MTLAAVAPAIDYLENGVSLTHPVPFQFVASTELVVERISPAGVLAAAVLGADYSVAGGAGETGSVTMALAKAAGWILRIRRVTAREQPTNYTAGDSFPAESHERALDRVTAIAQEIEAEGAAELAAVDLRAVKVPAGETAPTLPAAASRANKVPAFGATGAEFAMLSLNEDEDAVAVLDSLAGDDGGAFVGEKGPFAGEVRQTYAQVYANAPLTFERFGGAWDATPAANSAAAALITAALGGTGGRGKVLLHGRYQLAESWTLPMDCYHIEIEGQEGRYRSELRVMANNVPTVSPPEGAVVHSTALRRLELAGTGWEAGIARAQNGFYLPDTLDVPDNPDAYGLVFEDVGGRDLSGGVLRIGSHGFTVTCDRIHGDDIGGDMIYGGNNTWTMRGIYGHRLRKRGGEDSTGAVVRFLGGQLVMDGCNGLDQGDIMLDMGQALLDGDAVDNFAYADLSGINVEAFAQIGIRNRLGSFNLTSSTLTAKAGATAKAILTRNGGGGIGGVLDNPSCFLLAAGAAWADGQAVHTNGNRPPFARVLGGPDDASPLFSYYNEDDARTDTMAKSTNAHFGNGVWGHAISHLRMTHKMSVLNAAGSGLALADFADDAAAAAGSVAVGDLYRTGSAIKVRAA